MAGEKLETVEIVTEEPKGPQIKNFDDFKNYLSQTQQLLNNPPTIEIRK